MVDGSLVARNALLKTTPLDSGKGRIFDVHGAGQVRNLVSDEFVELTFTDVDDKSVSKATAQITEQEDNVGMVMFRAYGRWD